jgi:hypothetical protein
MLRQSADSLERQDWLEAEQHALAGTLEYVAGKVKSMDADTGYVTVLAYGRLKGSTCRIRRPEVREGLGRDPPRARR